jgi:hypothetical protein
METTQSTNSLVQELSAPLAQSKGWIKLLGVMMIIYGVMIAVSVVGLIIAWLPIWIGVLLFQAASAVEQAQVDGDADAMLRAMGKLKTYFTISGVLMLIGIIIGVVGFLLSISGVMTGLEDMQGPM